MTSRSDDPASDRPAAPAPAPARAAVAMGSTTIIPAADVTGLVLAGGRGSRMGGVDKGLQTLGGVPLALLALLRLQLQVGGAMVNANRNLQAYEGFGVPVVVDATGDFQGPLAGVLAGLHACPSPWMVTVPCDTPEFPGDLVARLADAAMRANADVAVAATRPVADAPPTSSTHDGLAWESAFLLVRTSLAPQLQAWLASGERKIDRWIAQQTHAVAVFPDAASFDNLNTTAELHAREQARRAAETRAAREHDAEQAARRSPPAT